MKPHKMLQNLACLAAAFAIINLANAQALAPTAPGGAPGVAPEAAPEPPNLPDKDGFIRVPSRPEGLFEKSEKVAPMIQWKSSTSTQTASAKDSSANFRFEGTALTDLTVSYVQFSCGCQNGMINGTTFKKGATIILTGSMTFAPGTGRHEKSLRVYTSEGGPSPLIVVADTPKLIEFSTKYFHWKTGDKKPQTLTITAVDDTFVQNVQILGGGFTHKVVKSGKTTSVEITPDGTNPNGALRITERDNPRPSYISLNYGDTKKSEPAAPTTAAPAPSPSPTVAPTLSPRTGPAPTIPQVTQVPQETSNEQMRADLRATRMLLEAALKQLDTYK